MRYGWSISRLPTLPDPAQCTQNDQSMEDYPEALEKYIWKGLGNRHIIGPFKVNPFEEKTSISPLSTVAKQNSNSCWVIVDLSFLIGRSVNDGISKDNYMGFFIKLKYPTLDALAKCMFTLGQDCWFYKMDMEGAFRQLQMDLADFGLIGYFWNGNFYFDLVLPMGLHSAPTFANLSPTHLRYIHGQLGYSLFNYIDDFQGAEKRQFVRQAYHVLERLFRDLDIKISLEKTVEPNQTVEFLGT